MNEQMPNAGRDADVLETLMKARHSCRAFEPTALPRRTIERILSIAQRTASWCNTQPWHVHIVSGPRLDEFRRLYAQKASEKAPDIEFPAAYRGTYLDRRRECGFSLYASLGIGREDKARAQAQMMRNYAFFGAPHLAVVSTDADLGPYGAIDCGGYIGTFLLAATSLGVAAVPQAAVASNSVFVREFLSIPDGRKVVAGIAFGLEDTTHPSNAFRTTRASIEQAVTWVDQP
jgi:nitroreductase